MLLFCILLCFLLLPSVLLAQDGDALGEDPEREALVQELHKKMRDRYFDNPERAERIALEREQYGFNAEYAQIIDYTWLPEDRISANETLFKMMRIWRNDKENTEEPLRIAREAIAEFRKTFDIWNFEADEKYKNDPCLIDMLGNQGLGLSQLTHLLGLALELHGDYDEALTQYGLVYGANPEAMFWTRARIRYKKGLLSLAFINVCDAINEYHDLSPINVDSAIQKVREIDEKMVKDNFHSDRDFFQTGSPIGRDKTKMQPDPELIELYRIRDWCVRFICPNITYLDPNAYNCDRFGRKEMIKKIRADYLAFIEFMEEEYKKWNEDEFDLKYPHKSVRAKAQQWEINRVEDAMALLRKMKELPY